MESPSLPVWDAAQVLRDEEALKASDIHAQEIMVTKKETLRDGKAQVSCDGCSVIPYVLYRFSRIMVAFHLLWPLVLYGCGVLDTSALPMKFLWTLPIWSGTLSAIAYIIWVSMKPYVYFFHTGIEECSDPKSTTHFRGRLRISSHQQVIALSCAFLTSRWATRMLSWDTWLCACTIIGTGWQRMRFAGCSNCELAFKVVSSGVGIILLIFFARMVTHLLLGVVKRFDDYRDSPQGMKLYDDYSQICELAGDYLRTNVNHPQAGAGTAQEEAKEREKSPKTAVAENQTLPAQVASLEAQLARLNSSNTHNEVLVIGLRKRVLHLEGYIDHLLQQPPTSDETRFATAKELHSIAQSREPKTEVPETPRPERSLANAASSPSEECNHQSLAQHASLKRKTCGFRSKHDSSLLRQRIAECANERAPSAQPCTEIGILDNISVTPEHVLRPNGVDAGSEWEEV